MGQLIASNGPGYLSCIKEREMNPHAVKVDYAAGKVEQNVGNQAWNETENHGSLYQIN